MTSSLFNIWHSRHVRIMNFPFLLSNGTSSIWLFSVEIKRQEEKEKDALEKNPHSGKLDHTQQQHEPGCLYIPFQRGVKPLNTKQTNTWFTMTGKVLATIATVVGNICPRAQYTIQSSIHSRCLMCYYIFHHGIGVDFSFTYLQTKYFHTQT